MIPDIEDKKQPLTKKKPEQYGIKLKVCPAMMGWMNPKLTKILLTH